MMNKHKSNKIKENSNTVRQLIMGQIITTQNLVAIKEVRHAGQQPFPVLVPHVYGACRLVPMLWDALHSEKKRKKKEEKWHTVPLTHWVREKNGPHFANEIFKLNFLYEGCGTLTQISMKFVPMGPVDNILALVQKMAWRRIGAPIYIRTNYGLVYGHFCVTKRCFFFHNNQRDLAKFRGTLSINILSITVCHEALGLNVNEVLCKRCW